ncbi:MULTISPECIES: MotA/TolQ/ExbB proton channel family protein [unclassified Fibrobacter]|uniref:MotA/TolQ/ExbB proton channel family protein n=1 Tax=unclassified Fibrobacter TaxID=2634177 RepID=UPI000D6C9C00|nr:MULTISPECIES: MotA/TolQ/ExbB proton channel family protein [unclassified Fibrobacter]PWJ64969.1 biopolymer transport protein ExbB [Fibrobacter sp. UWR4]PZW69034.1 biopolymer transport protein ExbB [Fibrobacter sp. UWR1]
MDNFMKVMSLVMFLALSAFAWPWSSKEAAVDSARIRDSLKLVEYKELQREVDALTRIRLQKADSLEKLEAEHWRKRYNETQLTEEHQTETRELDGRYSKLSTDLGRVNEEVMASKDVTTDAEEKAKSDESAYEALNTQVKLSVDKSLGEITGDYPVGMNERLVNLKKAQDEADAKNPNTLSVTRLYLEDLLKRHEMTYTQSYGSVNSQVGSRPDVSVNRLRLGTVFLGEVATDGSAGGLGEVQALLRSGALQGKIFEWNNTLPQEMSATIRTAVSQASDNQVTIPLDVLQNKAVKNSISDTKELTWKEELQAFFKKGGIVMYPLMLVAIFALLLCLERFIVLTLRGRIGKRFVKKVEGMVSEKRYEDAANFCLKKESALSMVMFSVLNKAKESRDAAEKSLQEALLREQPKLERRMGLLAAMGSIAPLLGLLGTVTGIITLFNVITEVGTNDARVLAGGISEALVTTETGLIIAIPVMILHGLLSEKIEKVTSELYVQSTSLLNKIFPKEETRN